MVKGSVQPGLCGQCAWSRLVTGAASTFVLCSRGLSDRTYPKYPVLPVRACRGYEAAGPRGDPSPEDAS